MDFKDRLKVGLEFMSYISRNDIKIPHRINARKRLFIKWYIERHQNKPFDELIEELSEKILYLKTVTVERLIFNEK